MRLAGPLAAGLLNVVTERWACRRKGHDLVSPHTPTVVCGDLLCRRCLRKVPA